MFPVFLGLMIVSTAAWLFLSKRLNHQLAKNYPDIYEALGKPKTVMRKSMRKNLLVLHFIFNGHKHEIVDAGIKRLCEGLCSLLVLYGFCLFGCLVLLLDWFM